MIEIKNVTKKYGEKIALDNISFNVNDGEIFAFIGHNGAGKREISLSTCTDDVQARLVIWAKED